MKIAICSDIHVCKNSSILRKSGNKFSMRLENCIKSISWFEQISKEHNCDQEIFLGDFFDTPTLDDQTITAIQEIMWNEIPKTAIVGNHESSVSSLVYSSLKTFESSIFKVISTPTWWYLENRALLFLPYVLESDRVALKDLLAEQNSNIKPIVFSHNDIAGIQMGPVVSKTGYTIEDIENNTELFINGHLHNGSKITDKIINLGILTGKDFGEDATRYSHNIMILDTETLEYELIENPYAFNFYKNGLEINSTADLIKLDRLKNNAIISVKCDESVLNETREKIASLSNVLESRITVVRTATGETSLDAAELATDHLAKFSQCCKEKLNNTRLLEEELAEILK